MPPRTTLSTRVARAVDAEGYICPSCLFTNRTRPQQLQQRQPQRRNHSRTTTAIRPHPFETSPLAAADKTYQQHLRQRNTFSRSSRSYASLASSTAINAPTSIPESLKPLYQSLQQLEKSSTSSYIDLARLQLALRSLESENPVIRIAFLGLGEKGEKAARRLVRVLLADALSDGVESWEKQILEGDGSGTLLVRYGEEVEDVGVSGGANTGRGREIRVPSPLLRKAGVEILVTGLNAAKSASQDGVPEEERLREWEDSLLVPALTIPGAGGRVGFVRYPVHKTMVVAEGVSGAVELGRMPRGLDRNGMIQSAVSLHLRTDGTTGIGGQDGNVVDIGLAEHALGLFRENRANGAVFSREWQTSKVGTVAEWLSDSSKTSEGDDSLKPAVKDLLDSLLHRTETAVQAADESALEIYEAQSVPSSKRSDLQQAVATWSKDAHHDLQTNLSTAFLGPTWKRTVWWRLFWRIDEVSISAADVLRRGWLVEAEQNLAFLSGRLLEAGVATENQLRGISQPIEDEGKSSEAATSATSGKTLLDERTEKEMADYDGVQQGILKDGRPETVAELMQLPPLLSKIREETGLNALFNPPWPQTVNLAREQILHEMVPNLHAKAQRLMLASLSTMGGSSALAAWLWVASGGVALYESGAIAAFGLVWALRRLQSKYGKEREIFAGTVREDARRVLADVEGRMLRLVRDGGRAVLRVEDQMEREEAKRTLEAVRAVLERVGKADK
ncbi:hypothetical protein CKM354_001085700 [Cercospora kikuchii]|uniref:Mmc1 C-terminal domain-containing protein n=1 Tax=Cercospora kikuchii TaxID=84275 RepID=A0A9P3FKT6_9PEZI|nr:uncharacterized protein CKM354_001085700 [Cercospora kikuchii]GIZ47774.1 hypothetical protein CKM354_001085700 [Cercospora kikuchii]